MTFSQRTLLENEKNSRRERLKKQIEVRQISFFMSCLVLNLNAHFALFLHLSKTKNALQAGSWERREPKNNYPVLRVVH